MKIKRRERYDRKWKTKRSGRANIEAKKYDEMSERKKRDVKRRVEYKNANGRNVPLYS